MSAVVALKKLSHLQNTPLEKFHSIDEAETCLNYWADCFEVRHMAYLATDLAEKNPKTACLVTTYPKKWVKRYLECDYVSIDPVIKLAREHTRPFYWSECASDDADIKEFFDDAKAHGLGEQGLTIPIHGAKADKAMFSVASDLGVDEWQGFCAQHMGNLILFSLQYHMATIDVRGALLNRPKLKYREVEILYWIAEGKTAWETSRILDISEKTVEHGLKQIRSKFNATNTTHAVSLAFRFGILH
ncbi:helix-turn-helix transcriptional regulator [Maritalea myrionectae]|uniref:Transcriptional activator protein RaiR n=1 Tax=Maritalea myrionectae TaxID=454601 RepID=A0A2R4MCI4_9HYPH|nr:LuxR family transcriptional regulator [Maritalea myrionectae]AVX03683.1 transcriptional activator protein RaiR [Maritalea myrionectae]